MILIIFKISSYHINFPGSLPPCPSKGGLVLNIWKNFLEDKELVPLCGIGGGVNKGGTIIFFNSRYLLSGD